MVKVLKLTHIFLISKIGILVQMSPGAHPVKPAHGTNWILPHGFIITLQEATSHCERYTRWQWTPHFIDDSAYSIKETEKRLRKIQENSGANCRCYLQAYPKAMLLLHPEKGTSPNSQQGRRIEKKEPRTIISDKENKRQHRGLGILKQE